MDRHEGLELQPLALSRVVGTRAPFNFSVILPVFAKSTFHGSGGTYGLMAHPKRRFLVLATLAFGVALALTAAAPNVPSPVSDSCSPG